MNTVLKNKRSRVWLTVTSIVLAVVLVLNIVGMTALYEVLCSVLGGKRVVYNDSRAPLFSADYDSKAETLKQANLFNERIAEEGTILLKNQNHALPIYTKESRVNQAASAPKISVFGKNSVNIAIGGSGSGGSNGGETKSVYDSLEAAGYELNPTLKKFYESADSGKTRPASPENSNLDDGKSITVPTYETPLTAYSSEVWASFADYSDAAVMVITRMGGEGFDLPRTMDGVEGARKADDHYLQLDQNEADLLNMICNYGFKKVILVLNVGTSMELGFLKEETEKAYNTLKDYHIDSDKIDACLWMGFPGASGAMALGRILNGNVNPSGRTTDTYALDFKKDPTWNNFADSNGVNGGDRYTSSGSPADYYFVDYEEGVYVGYRYYETRGSEDEAWYAQNVVFPMGYGLSYTDFAWEVVDDGALSAAEFDPNGRYEITVRVTNTGDVAGKDVVQLYGSAPYTPYEIEKPYEVLLDFAKTGLLQPGESEDVKLTFNPYYMASFDYNDNNYNGFAGYELEAGDYQLHISKNAHEAAADISFTLPEGVQYAGATTLYTGNDDALFDSDLQLTNGTLLRAEWEGTWPQTRTVEEHEIDRTMLDALADTSSNNPTDYSAAAIPASGKTASVMFSDMVTDTNGQYGFKDGQEKWQPFVDSKDSRWNALLDACKPSELLQMVNYGAFKTDKIESIGKPLTNDTDGPAGFVNFMLMDGTYYGTCYYAAQIVVASTWNTELAKEFGEMVGNEGIWGADGQGNGLVYSGWYAPGMNIHRSPFGGRNFEYMSEDGVFTGKMAAAQIRGCQSKGVYCFMKHFAINDQETHRSNNGISVWLTEQAMREIYLRPFEIAVKEGGSRAVMSSFNRIGTRWTGGDYRLITQILRNEWGFVGTVITDFTSGKYMNARQMAYAGGNLNLNNQSQFAWNDFDASNAADMTVLRNNAQELMYTVVNSNAVNREIIGYSMPMWCVWFIAADIAIVVALGLWGFFAVRSAKKKEKNPARA